jgi:16S rRNA (cytosine1402-N4)-methyltransferase
MWPASNIEDPSTLPQHAHEPALLRETVELLRPQPGATIVDGTLGPGGHAEALLEAVGPEGRVLGIDRDPHALELARRRLERFGDSFVAIRGNHDDLVRLLHERDIEQVDGILFDLGVSSLQLDDPSRGFSFRADGPLDMRMDPESGQTAAEMLATASEDELRRIFWRYGEERRSAAIAREIVERREKAPLRTTRELATLIRDVIGPVAQRYRIHPATRTFQAIRIAVNREVDDLERLVTEAVSVLATGGRLAVISYHSLEDRAVKGTMRSLAQRCICPPKLPVCGCGREDLLQIVTQKPIRPSSNEIARNPRARSARLRVGERR